MSARIGCIIVTDSELHDVCQVFGTDIFKILERMKDDGFEIKFTGDLPHLAVNPVDLRKL